MMLGGPHAPVINRPSDIFVCPLVHASSTSIP
jgi:hypothetical protein